MDCSWVQGDKGCNGGLMDNAFKYVVKNGITRESDYSYKAKSSYTCNANKFHTIFKISGYKGVNPTN